MKQFVWAMPAALVLASSLCYINACAPTAPKESAYPMKLSAKRPHISPLAETKALQERGGITLSVEPVLYDIKLDSIVKDEPRNPDFLELLGEPEGTVCIQRTVTPTVSVVPQQLCFTVRLTNNLNHVIRGAGTVVSLVIDGRQVAIDPGGYSDLTSAMVTPRGELSMKIWGPALNLMPDSCNIGLFLYDFVTATDAAGNATEKQTFEWYYAYKADVEYISGQSRSAKMLRRPVTSSY